MQLQKIFKVTATLRCVSGLHIGAGDAEMHIGGIDNSVVKNPLTGKPYIPGSSLKGKMRSLAEWRTGRVQEKPLDLKRAQGDESALQVLKLFGVSGDNNSEENQTKIAEMGTARLAFWDCHPQEQWLKEIEARNISPTEAKYENSINRITGVAESPRQTERVIAGALFDFALSVKVLDGDDEKQLCAQVFSLMKLLELDSLGGSGSRGYGKVVFENVFVDGQCMKDEYAQAKAF